MAISTSKLCLKEEITKIYVCVFMSLALFISVFTPFFIVLGGCFDVLVRAAYLFCSRYFFICASLTL